MKFTFDYIRDQLRRIQDQGYEFITCSAYVELRAAGRLPARTVVNRVDIDLSCRKAGRLASVFNDLGVHGSFFVRLHAPEYNPFAFEEYLVLKQIRDAKHEIALHSEVVDASVIWQEDAAACLRRDLNVLSTLLDTKIVGAASHGAHTGMNNLDFWRDQKPAAFGLLYEGYDTEPEFGLFNRSLYVSDSEWTRWKCYLNGVRCEGDHREPAEHAAAGAPLIYLTTHGDTYYERHPYEKA